MRISVTFRHLESSDAIKDYLSQKLLKLNKYFDGPIDASAVLSVEKFRQLAEISVVSGRFTINCTEESDDMYQSIDKCIDKVERKVKRQREKSRRKGPDQERLAFEAEADRQESMDWSDRIVSTEEAEEKPMSLEEAMKKMDANLNAEFLVFTNADTQKVNVLFRRKDGNYGIVETH